MKRSLILTLIAILALSASAQPQKRRAKSQADEAPAATTPAPSYQNGDTVQVTICKGLPIPDGYVTAGETAMSDCRNGAWILKRRGTRLYPDEAPAPYNPPASAQVGPPRTDDGDEPAPSSDSRSAVARAVLALRRMHNATALGVTFNEYRSELLSLKGTLDGLLPRLPEGTVRSEILGALGEYYYAHDMWSLMVRNGFDWVSAEGNGPGNELMMKYNINPIRDRRGQRILTRQLVMGAIWAKATEHVQAAVTSLDN